VDELTPVEPVANASPPIAAAPPAGLPTDPAALEDAVLAERRRRFGDQMERANRRAALRAGQPTPPPPPSAPGPGHAAAGNSRRSAALSPDGN
jgi:hypothetical protein